MQKERHQSQTLSTEEFQSVIKCLTKEARKCERNPFCKTTIHTNRALQFSEGADSMYQCSAGKQLLTILADGTLLPCRRLPLSIGNVLQETIVSLECSSPIIQELKQETIPEGCNKCLHASKCQGGAKCLTYAVTGSYTKKDINCYLPTR